jgi:hypothetical protein
MFFIVWLENSPFSFENLSEHSFFFNQFLIKHLTYFVFISYHLKKIIIKKTTSNNRV